MEDEPELLAKVAHRGDVTDLLVSHTSHTCSTHSFLLVIVLHVHSVESVLNISSHSYRHTYVVFPCLCYLASTATLNLVTVVSLCFTYSMLISLNAQHLSYFFTFHLVFDDFSIFVSLLCATLTRPGLRCADSTLYRLPRCRTSMGECAFSFSGPLA